MMAKLLLLLVVANLVLLVHAQQQPDEALRECVNLHHIEITNFPNSTAKYEQDKCQLKCYIDGHELAADALNEGFACPLNHNGVSSGSSWSRS